LTSSEASNTESWLSSSTSLANSAIFYTPIT
jgi:hypothetical protein